MATTAILFKLLDSHINFGKGKQNEHHLKQRTL